MKYILISLITIFFSACTVEKTIYNTLQAVSEDKCELIVYEFDRLECENKGRQSYEEYQKYYEDKQ